MLTVFTLATKTLFASTLPGRLRVPVADLSATASGSATISTSVKQERTNATSKRTVPTSMDRTNASAVLAGAEMAMFAQV